MESKNWMKRGLCLGLAGVMALTNVICAFAKAGEPSCDEAMYISLDPYGTAKEASVVKSYDLHGSNTIVDYGTYLEIHNMTDYTEPVVEGNQVTFRLEQQPAHDRFYFEGIMDPAQTVKNLPWDIAVSYKLNGVEKNMEDLIHEKGLVEITIDAVPNENVDEYYRNNMTLEIAAMVDMEKNLSVEAPGAQVQSVGNLKAVLFMVFPGEEQHFTLDIGSDDFEFSGMIFMMVPVTLSQMDNLADLREARDTIKDSADAISDSLDIILDSLEGVEDGLALTVDGLNNLDQSRQIISRTKDGMYVDADHALEVLKELSEEGKPFTGYVQEAQNALNDINQDINDLTDSVMDLDDHLEDLNWEMTDVRDDLKELETLLDAADSDLETWIKLLEKLKSDLELLKGYKQALKEAKDKIQGYIDSIGQIKGTLEDHEDILGLSSEELEQLLVELDIMLGKEIPDISVDEKWAGIVASSSNAMQEIGGIIAGSDAVAGADAELKQLIARLEALLGSAEQENKLDQMIAQLQAAITAVEQIIYRVEDGGESLGYVLSDSRDVIGTIKSTSKTGQDLVEDISQLRKTVNRYHTTAVNAAADAVGLIDSAVRGTDALYKLMLNVEQNMKAAGVPLNEGTKDTLQGLTDALNEAIKGLSKTGVIRDAKTTIEDLIEDKWDEYTGEEMTILNADVNAEKLSFTSSKNPEPQSIQIILRTEGTSEVEDEIEITVDENFHAEGNFIQRIFSIFKEIVNAVLSVFAAD